MIIYESLEDVKKIGETAVALGNFDGVHLGHQKLIKKMVDCAKSRRLKSLVFTFSNHPKDLLPGVAKVKNIPFTHEIMTMIPKDFIEKILLDKFNMKAAFCGFNYRFGLKAAGNPDVLREFGRKDGFTVSEMEPFKIKDNIVSSSMIRTLIASGQVERCETYMGRNYEIGGEVVVGNRLGRKLGFSTSNLVIDETMVTPPNGVYVTYVDYNGKRYPSVTNVGTKPTVGEYEKNVETHIFDFDKELYGKRIIVEFLKKTRDEVKFDDFQELSDQIVRDCKEAKEFHNNLKKRGTL